MTTNANGKQKRTYRWYATPWEILRQLPGVAGYLRPELTLDQLARIAAAKSDTEARLRCSKPSGSSWPACVTSARLETQQGGGGNYPPPRRPLSYLKTQPKKGDSAADHFPLVFRLILQ